MGASKPPLVVAVVEDDPPSRTALGRLLRAAGFEPALFESAEAYIDPAPSIIVTTSKREDVIRERAQQNGCAAFFWKAIDGNVLDATIASLANH